MLKKLLITLKYGEQKAKTLIIVILALLVSGLGLLIFGIIDTSIIPLGAGALLMIIGLLLLFSFSFVDIDVNMEKKIQKKRDNLAKKNDKKENSATEKKTAPESPPPGIESEIDFSMFEDDLSDIAIGIGGLSIPNVNEGKEETHTPESDEIVEEEETEEEEESENKKDKKKKKRKKKSKDISDDENDEYGSDNLNLGEEEEESGNETKVRVNNKDFEVKKPTPKQIKARKKMLKVRKDDRRFTPIIVDSWKEVSALRVPAFVQDKGKMANIVLVEGALRTELMPMQEFLEVTYQKNVEENFMEQYEEIRKDPDVNGIFGELFPAFYQSGKGSSEKMCKNLYILGGKLAITPRSLRKLFNKYDFQFKVFDSLDIKGDYSEYFKESYESRIFWTDNVISQNDYQERIRGILQSMIEDTKMVNYDFERDLQLMVRYNLITKEYADYYKARKNDRIKIRI